MSEAMDCDRDVGRVSGGKAGDGGRHREEESMFLRTGGTAASPQDGRIHVFVLGVPSLSSAGKQQHEVDIPQYNKCTLPHT